MKPKPEHGKIMHKIIDMPLLEQIGFGVVFRSEQTHDASVCGLVARMVAMASPTCLKNTGRGRSSHLEGHSHERGPENRWVSCQLPRVPTPCETKR